jgi:hypothetical protein
MTRQPLCSCCDRVEHEGLFDLGTTEGMIVLGRIVPMMESGLCFGSIAKGNGCRSGGHDLKRWDLVAKEDLAQLLLPEPTST